MPNFESSKYLHIFSLIQQPPYYSIFSPFSPTYFTLCYELPSKFSKTYLNLEPESKENIIRKIHRIRRYIYVNYKNVCYCFNLFSDCKEHEFKNIWLEI